MLFSEDEKRNKFKLLMVSFVSIPGKVFKEAIVHNWVIFETGRIIIYVMNCVPKYHSSSSYQGPASP